jgi:hypothetical protein
MKGSGAMKNVILGDQLEQLAGKGVELIDPRQIYIDSDVSLHRIFPGAILFPGTRLSGARTLVAPGAKIGSEGPATVVDSAIGENAEIASGYVAGSVLLNKARIGSNGHVRAGTLLEEEASTAHAVGLKQTILTSFVTLGSLINCCDCLVSGGRSRSNHTEIGSGFIHFNFTPWGENGDKATPSLIGDVPRGVFLREERIFIGGSSGMVGPSRMGFGSFSVAGQVIRNDIKDQRIHSETSRRIDAPWNFQGASSVGPRVAKNLEYIGQLLALRTWYEEVRKARLPKEQAASHPGLVIDEAIRLLDGAIKERLTQLERFLKSTGGSLAPVQFPARSGVFSWNDQGGKADDHVAWVKTLSAQEVARGTQWLQGIVDDFVDINRRPDR